VRVRKKVLKVYLNEETYKELKELARKKKMSASTYAMLLIKKKILKEKFRGAL